MDVEEVVMYPKTEVKNYAVWKFCEIHRPKGPAARGTVSAGKSYCWGLSINGRSVLNHVVLMRLDRQASAGTISSCGKRSRIALTVYRWRLSWTRRYFACMEGSARS